jgi:hypothetical protein
MAVLSHSMNDVPTASARRRMPAATRVLVAAALVFTSLAGPAAAGHGAVSYENPKKIAEQKQREKEAASGQPAVAPAPKAPVVVAPAAAAPAAVPVGDRNQVYATTARRELSELAAIAEEQIANGTDAELAALAKRHLESIRKQIAELDQWLAAHP